MQEKNEKILKELSLKITPARVLMLALFEQAKKPYSATEILNYLHKNKLKTDEATVYRNIKTFLSKKVLKEVDLRGDQKFYELKSLPHHHHLVCNKCSNIKPLHTCGVEKMQNEIEKKGFKVVSHSLEFFGICKKCQK